MNPPPPSTLNKETVGVWHGWCNIGDKEVAREAAAKGTHVHLAISFLSLRKKVSFEDAQNWFRTEVVKWVHELLDRKQIFRASHVLNNIGLNSSNQFSKIFYTTDQQSLRKYIGNHLMKQDQLEEKLKHLWTFLNLIFDNSELISSHKGTIKNIQGLDNLDENHRSEFATVLFLKTKENVLTRFIIADTLWKHLLINNDVNSLVMWINIKCSVDLEECAESSLIELFKKFDISTEMIDKVSNLDVSLSTQNVVYNELSKFGIFSSTEKTNLLLILKRLKSSYSLANTHEILSKVYANVNLEKFHEILVNYCCEKKYFNVLNAFLKNHKTTISIKIPEIEFLNEFHRLVEDFSEILLSENIFNVANMLSDVEKYFIDHPVVFLSFLFFTKDINILDAALTGARIETKDVVLNACFINLFKQFKTLNHFFVKMLTYSEPPNSIMQVYDLLFRYLNGADNFLLELKFLNNDLLKFYKKDLLVDAYSKNLNYKFYVKELRPSYAIKVHFVQKAKSGESFKENDKVFNKLCKIALGNFESGEVCASCVSFAEMCGSDSSKVRIFTKVAQILNESEYYKDIVTDLFYTIEQEPYTVQNIVETVLFEKFIKEPLTNGDDLLKIFRIYEIVVSFSKVTNTRLPELFLRWCASQNLWLPFLLFAQIYDYPPEQIKLLIQYFKSPNMLEHLTHGSMNDIQVEERNVLIRDRDSRNYLLSKVGVRKSLDSINQHSSFSLKSQSSYESAESSLSSDSFEIDVSNIKATLLQTLIRCHNSTDPPKALLQASQLYRNPLLAIFATSYEPDSLVTNWLTWLSVSCELHKVFTNYETTALSAAAVAALLENCLKHQYPKTLLESFQIFLPDHPLKIFTEFLNNCFELKLNQTTLSLALSSFRTVLKSTRKNSLINEVDHEMTYLNNRVWIEHVALRLLSALLEYNCSSPYDQILIVRTLCEIKIWTYFSCECPNFYNMLYVLESLHFNNTAIRPNISVIFDEMNKREAIIACLNKLLDKQQYKVALQIATIENLPKDLILVKEWQSKMRNRNDQNFWNTCNDTFTENNVTADCVVDFYLHSLEKISDSLEKFTLVKFAWEWAVKYDLTCQYELEQKMWLAFLCLEEKHRSLDMFHFKRDSTYLYKELIDSLTNVYQFDGELGKDFVAQLERIIAQLLNMDKFSIALRLQQMFACKSTDLETLKLCHSLAEGILLPYQLNAEQRLLLSNVNSLRSYSHRRTFLSTKFSSLSSSSHSPATSLQMQTLDAVDAYTNDTLGVLKLLSEHLHNGVEIGQKIFMNYRISLNIEVPYQVVVMTADHSKMLKDALEDNCLNKIDVIHDFIMAHNWSKHEVADFICQELISAATLYTDFSLDHLLMWDLNLDQDFHLILQLLQENCSLLGYKIYAYASTFHKSQIESTQLFKDSDFCFITELLIRAHDCFTADCNMEGIYIILKKAKEIVSNLLVLQNWKLMLRILTGVGRYTEMNYVFQILKENDQFEVLLRKGFRKDNSLKVALLEYLRKYCPDNKDLYKIVALHFALFSEVALLWEREAQSVINNLISVSILEMQNNKLVVEEEPFVLLQNTESTQICLKKAMENYIHATDFHLQGEKLMKANNSTKQAELIALQISFLKEVAPNASIICLLNLKSSQISDLILHKLGFEQSLIVSEAYNFHTDWAAMLYEQYVINNNGAFFEGFLQHLPLTDTLVYDISRKFANSKSTSANQVKCMKAILNKSLSLQMKYRIASELGFSDLVEDMITSGQLAYLKDTVWKRGYKS